jgi:large-conductance mechanosensitive channel
MFKIRTFLKRLIGRIRRMGEQICLALGSTFIATGLITEIEYPDIPFVWITCMVAAVCFFFFAIRIAKDKEKEQRREREQQNKAVQGLLTDIRDELRKSNEGKTK